MLYKGVAFIDNPRVFYIGMQDQWYTFNMFDAQAWWVRDVMIGRIAIPDRDTMQADIDARIKAEGELTDDYARIDYQGAYTIPGKYSIVKVAALDFSTVASIKTYIDADQNPLSIKKDLELWSTHGFEESLVQIIDCKEELNKAIK